MRLRTGGRSVTAVADMVRALRDVTKAEAVAVVNRDGGIVAAELPQNVSQETFSIMCAAILGAGMTAATELGHTAPHRVLLESDDATVVIQELGRRAMVVLVVSPERVVSDLDAAILRFAQAAAKDLDRALREALMRPRPFVPRARSLVAMMRLLQSRGRRFDSDRAHRLHLSAESTASVEGRSRARGTGRAHPPQKRPWKGSRRVRAPRSAAGSGQDTTPIPSSLRATRPRR